MLNNFLGVIVSSIAVVAAGVAVVLLLLLLLRVVLAIPCRFRIPAPLFIASDDAGRVGGDGDFDGLNGGILYYVYFEYIRIAKQVKLHTVSAAMLGLHRCVL